MNYDATEAEIDENVEAYREWLMAQRAKIRESFDGVKGMIYAPVAMFEVVTFDMLERTQRQTRSELLAEVHGRAVDRRALGAVLLHVGMGNLPEVDGIEWADYLPSCYCAGCNAGDECECDD